MASIIELKKARNEMHHAKILMRAHHRYLDYINVKESIQALVKTHGINQMFRDNCTFDNKRRLLDLMGEEVVDVVYHYGIIKLRFYRNGYVELSFV